MADYVTIANMAASLIGEDDQIMSPSDDTHIGRTIAAVWDLCRRAAIRDHSWNCFMTRKGLSAEALAAVPYPWGYSFRLPSECLRLVEVLNLADDDYQLEGRSVLCNSIGPVYIRYLQDLPEPALWDDLFAVAFSRRLAVQIGTRIAGSSYDRSAGWQLYQDALSQAKRVDARENPQVAYEPSSWEMARLGGSFIPGPGR
ncbi:hypothetical protein FIM10_01825 [Sphingomonadales bacterium 56]|uniref:hypothetical protein n=1 Tax=unclassified Sphingobium TaxID=2611147 RepID=UPI00191A67C5|nr:MULTISPECIES: hypothetical protein [unclassified Sphingobium]MBY2927422.1 hypothetical protein [Sphingomonadales bacterium 56]MBY2957490.1 hypothetical protein [Sphingomonadales bacterium 58]MBY2957533.1 hypothetical protein [Sphingomonadales bacterium 58]CAD7335159.1 hypothetical protein SPHS8_00367 [Sphingobium sp. S8]CAD7335178.1 hypothetical protein SPHS6_00367 [Sphingobium sp. S6]